MPFVQETYTENLNVAQKGFIADLRPSAKVSLTSKSVTPVLYGSAVMHTAKAGECVLDGDPVAGTRFAGITLATTVGNDTPDAHIKEDSLSALKEGAVFVEIKRFGVAFDDQVAFHPASGEIGGNGAGMTLIADSRFEQAGAIGDVVRVYLASRT